MIKTPHACQGLCAGPVTPVAHQHLQALQRTACDSATRWPCPQAMLSRTCRHASKVANALGSSPEQERSEVTSLTRLAPLNKNTLYCCAMAIHAKRAYCWGPCNILLRHSLPSAIRRKRSRKMCIQPRSLPGRSSALVRGMDGVVRRPIEAPLESKQAASLHRQQWCRRNGSNEIAWHSFIGRVGAGRSRAHALDKTMARLPPSAPWSRLRRWRP